MSRQSGRVTFPQSAKSVSSSKSVGIFLEDDASDANPFKVPADQDIFMLRDKERQRKKDVRKCVTLLVQHTCYQSMLINSVNL